MKSVNTKELRQLSDHECMVRVHELRYALLQLRLKAATEHAPAFGSHKRALRKSIARALTVAHEQCCNCE